MPRGWLRRNRSPHEAVSAPEMPPEVTAAFFDMDSRQGAAQQAVAAEGALNPGSPILGEWDIVRQSCYGASASYLALSTHDPGAQGPDQVRRQLVEAAAGVDHYCQRHRSVLDRATSQVMTAAQKADSSLAVVQVLNRRLNGVDGQWLIYPSVRTANDLMQSTAGDLRSARERADLAATISAADRLSAAVAQLELALDRAPQRVEEANRAVSSVRTRLEAARTRAASADVALSDLLREFHADSSADIVDNERKSRAELDRADSLLKQASMASREGCPETALEFANEARLIISPAEALIDSAGNRLSLLRSIRDSPSQRERDVRFQVRDAQRLVIDRGIQAEWGTVLDAQVGRIDRIVAELHGRHPNYWKYHLGLGEVSEFVARIVARIRRV